MKPILMKRFGLLLAAVMIALAWLGAAGGSALAQTAGGSQTRAFTVGRMYRSGGVP